MARSPCWQYCTNHNAQVAGGWVYSALSIGDPALLHQSSALIISPAVWKNTKSVTRACLYSYFYVAVHGIFWNFRGRCHSHTTVSTKSTDLMFVSRLKESCTYLVCINGVSCICIVYVVNNTTIFTDACLTWCFGLDA